MSAHHPKEVFAPDFPVPSHHGFLGQPCAGISKLPLSLHGPSTRPWVTRLRSHRIAAVEAIATALVAGRRL